MISTTSRVAFTRFNGTPRSIELCTLCFAVSNTLNTCLSTRGLLDSHFGVCFGLYRALALGLGKAALEKAPFKPKAKCPFTDEGTYIPDPSDTTGYNSDIIGLSWITFDSTSGTSGKATPRIFVGVANAGSNSVFVSQDGGSTWSAVAGQPTTYMPHKGVLSPAEKTLYVTYSNGAGPYDGTLGAVFKYNIATSTWTDITPVSGSDLYFGFGGFSVDLKKPGTIMVAALNSWPDGQIFRSTDSGATWSPLWAWVSYPTMNKFYSYSDALAPWIGPDFVDTTPGDLQIGWMMESLSIDPFNSDHFLYGTGETIYGSFDLTKWDTSHNITLQSLADGIEETSVQGLISPPVGPPLLSAVGDVEGFVHNSLTVAPKNEFTGLWSTSADIDYAGLNPTNIARVGTGDSTQGLQVSLSTDSGATWFQDFGASSGVTGGKVALSASGDTVLWSSASNGVLVSQFTSAFTAVSSLPSGSIIASDKANNSVFYAASGSKFYLSVDGGKTFTAKASPGTSTSPAKIAVNPKVQNDVWISTDKGLFHSTNAGTSFTAISGVTQAWAIALGAPATTGGYPALFAAGNLGGTVGYFRSDDQGVNFVQINDAAHGFGSASANCIAADPRVYGRVFIGTNGRGIFFGVPQGAAPAPTATAKPTSATTVAPTSSHASTTSSVTTSSHSTSSVSTVKTSTAPTSTSTSGLQSAFGQCGGQGWTGPTACVAGFSCVVQNPFFSQCVQS